MKREPSDELQVTGIAVYRRNLLRLVRTPEQFEHELRFALFDELALFFQLDDDRRAALGLPPQRAAPEEPKPAPDDDSDGSPRRSRRRRRMHS